MESTVLRVSRSTVAVEVLGEVAVEGVVEHEVDVLSVSEGGVEAEDVRVAELR